MHSLKKANNLYMHLQSKAACERGDSKKVFFLYFFIFFSSEGFLIGFIHLNASSTFFYKKLSFVNYDKIWAVKNLRLCLYSA